MKSLSIFRFTTFVFTFVISFFIYDCSGGDSGGNSDSTPSPATLNVSTTNLVFGEVLVMDHSDPQNISIGGSNLIGSISVSSSDGFEISKDNTNFTDQLTFLNPQSTVIFVRFSPIQGDIGNIEGDLIIQSPQAENVVVELSGVGLSNTPTISSSNSNVSFSETQIFEHSESFGVLVTGQNLTSVINLVVGENFEISLDNLDFTNEINIPLVSANGETTVYIRFSPTEVGNHSTSLNIQSDLAPNVEVSLSGFGAPVVHTYETFQDQPLGFGGGFSQSNVQVFNLHEDLTNVSEIKMFLQIDCPSTGCDDWDRFANVKVKDPNSDSWFEIGRYITPYWVGTQQLDRGLEFDVTDFKSYLTGSTELRIYIENWTAKADLVTIEFDYVEGTPDYPFYAVSEVLGLHSNSIAGIPYGVSHNLDLDRSIQIPSNAESTELRTVISGWGHATPGDSDGRRCAEWCYRTHDVKINGSAVFQHYMGPIGCAANPINNQNPGNWTPDRAGWCPGMVVPVRKDDLGTTYSGSSFTFEYDLEDWTSDGAGGNAFYATSTYVVVKSSTPLTSPIVN